jgi:predicted aldo/keto reductase-like oxidoreductase
MMDFNIRKLGFGLMCLPMLGDKVDIEQTKKMTDLFMRKGFTYFDTAYVWQVSNGNRASACIGCGDCESVCPQSIPIIEELKKASAIFD